MTNTERWGIFELTLTAEETGNVQAVLDGDLTPFSDAYLQWRRANA